MKFRKFSLLTALVCSAFAFILFHASCERNVCNNVTCFNGGSCNMGICNCPLGYEDPQCQRKSVDRYLGVYSGYTKCNEGGYLIDSVWIESDPKRINFVYVSFKSILPKKLHGFVQNSASTYSVIIPNDSGVNYLKQYSLTLQGDKMLKLHTYEASEQPGDTVYNSCMFNGSKQ